ncbi:hypothetical protein Scep_005888 [Stephania cephalantha]|uniref:Uncharacterized protein n=1 Tax=Stephania cephalantha TaxID=152367 RepID=A0AAP0KYJ2_9MAGN
MYQVFCSSSLVKLHKDQMSYCLELVELHHLKHEKLKTKHGENYRQNSSIDATFEPRKHDIMICKLCQ